MLDIENKTVQLRYMTYQTLSLPMTLPAKCVLPCDATESAVIRHRAD